MLIFKVQCIFYWNLINWSVHLFWRVYWVMKIITFGSNVSWFLQLLPQNCRLFARSHFAVFVVLRKDDTISLCRNATLILTVSPSYFLWRILPFLAWKLTVFVSNFNLVVPSPSNFRLSFLYKMEIIGRLSCLKLLIIALKFFLSLLQKLFSVLSASHEVVFFDLTLTGVPWSLISIFLGKKIDFCACNIRKLFSIVEVTIWMKWLLISHFLALNLIECAIFIFRSCWRSLIKIWISLLIVLQCFLRKPGMIFLIVIMWDSLLILTYFLLKPNGWIFSLI